MSRSANPAQQVDGSSRADSCNNGINGVSDIARFEVGWERVQNSNSLLFVTSVLHLGPFTFGCGNYCLTSSFLTSVLDLHHRGSRNLSSFHTNQTVNFTREDDLS
jgi:hypothetical protein